ncbi:hypothetical protein DM860_008748 [Cuscuta australis]|uniref:Intimal thickness related receptor IRP domain-containing protein n=1 Tax=Cuscuta australis TaxID=267555 RepID=A0A328D7D2_9ASTE|nr:hypothetical protein DM860_008748 [Cuscuta australis]
METPVVVVFLVIWSILSPSLVAGEVRHTEIRADDRAAIPLNAFFFTRGGQLELNITRLAVLPVPDRASLSKIGFVLLPPDSWNDLSFGIPERNATCALEYPGAFKVLTLDQIPKSAQWNLLRPAPAKDSQYTLVFANCLGVKVSMNLRSAMYNRLESGGGGRGATVSYLMAGPILPQVYFLFALICSVLVVIWVITVLENRVHVAWIHYYLLATLLLKALNLYCEALQKWHIDRSGSPTMWLDALFYASSLLRAISFYTAVLVIGCTQWQILRPRFRLRARDKGVLAILVSLQLVANAARVMSDKAAGLYGETWWLPVFAFVNCVSLWLLVFSLWSALRNLLTVRTHKRATVVLKKYELFRHYFTVVVVYILFGPILEYLLLVFAAASSSEYYWLISVALESVTLAFYAYTGYLFAPRKNSPHHHHIQCLLREEDEEAAAAIRLGEEEDDYATLFSLV